MSFNDLTPELTNIIRDAQSMTTGNGNSYIESAHVLLVLLTSNASTTKVLQNTGVDIQKLTSDLNVIIGGSHKGRGTGKPEISEDLLNLFDLARKESQKYGDKLLSPNMLLLAFCEDDTESGKLARKHGLNKASMEVIVSSNGALKKYTVDLTAKARSGKIDPVIGRDDEIRRTIQILARRGKNNPVLIGEPGVGKTAIVEGLAQRIVNGEVPDDMKSKRVLSLDITALVAGACYVGDTEKRMNSILKELEMDAGETILFIDELHIMVGAGAGEKSAGLGDMLKPALARGDFSCVGATTLDEYRKYIEVDPALERRFQKVMVAEPSVKETITILRGLRQKFEVHHKVVITDQAIIAAAEMSHRYITNRFLPDKAIDLIDEAASKIKIEINSRPEVMDKLYRKTIQLKMEREAVGKEHDEGTTKQVELLGEEIAKLESEYAALEKVWIAEKASVQGSAKIKEEIEKTRAHMEEASRKGDWQTASELQYGRLPELEATLKQADQVEAADRLSGKIPKMRLLRTEVGADEIAEIVSRATGVQVTRMLLGEREKLSKMEEFLHKRLIGQSDAVVAVSDAIRRSRSGLGDATRPYGSFLFTGPSGVGKTELCKALAGFLFDSEEALIRFDMSEFMTEQSVSRLIGSAPGYAGSDKGGQLTEAVRRKPYSVILLDEVEKAHPDVFNVFLQVLDEGRLTDGSGVEVNFKNTVIIMTSNLGAQKIQEMQEVEHSVIQDAVMVDICKHFRPEFINRIDEIVMFHPLDFENISTIAKLQLRGLKDRLAKLEIGMNISAEAFKKISEAGFDPMFGARPLKRAIQKLIENPLSRLLLDGRYSANQDVRIDVVDNKIVFQ